MLIVFVLSIIFVMKDMIDMIERYDILLMAITMYCKNDALNAKTYIQQMVCYHFLSYLLSLASGCYRTAVKDCLAEM